PPPHKWMGIANRPCVNPLVSRSGRHGSLQCGAARHLSSRGDPDVLLGAACCPLRRRASLDCCHDLDLGTLARLEATRWPPRRLPMVSATAIHLFLRKGHPLPIHALDACSRFGIDPVCSFTGTVPDLLFWHVPARLCTSSGVRSVQTERITIRISATNVVVA